MKTITLVLFRRTRKSKQEKGIAIGNSHSDIDIILDKNLKLVGKQLWSYEALPYELTISFEF